MPSITINHTTTNFTNQVTTKKYIVWHDTGVLDQSDEGNANYFKSSQNALESRVIQGGILK